MPEKVDCNICASGKLQQFSDRGKYALTKCLGCGLIFTSPRPTPDEIGDLYGKNYLANLKSVSDSLIKISRKRLRFVERYKKGGRLLDIGAGNGYFLELARSAGWEIYGTESSKYCRDYCKKNFGIALLNCQPEHAPFGDRYFDIITMWHVIEHLRNPMGSMIEMWRILKDDGLLFLITPNVKFLLNYIKGLKSMSDIELSEHLYHFSKKTLVIMLKKADFRIVNISVGDIESIRQCYRERIYIGFSYLGRAVSAITGLNLTDSIRIVTAKGESVG